MYVNIYLVKLFCFGSQAMLVHPDKNMGNEKAVEAFKKLQNAYEVRVFGFLFSCVFILRRFSTYDPVYLA